MHLPLCYDDREGPEKRKKKRTAESPCLSVLPRIGVRQEKPTWHFVTSDCYAELKRLSVDLKAAIKNRAKLDPNDTSKKIIAVQETMLEVILQIRKESEYLAGFDPDDRKIEGLRDVLSEIPKGSAPAAGIDRLAARLEGILAGATQTTPDNQAENVDAPPAIIEPAPTPSMDRVLQTDPIWTTQVSQKSPIPVTRLSGKVVWRNPSAKEQPDEAVLAPEEELRIAEVVSTGRTELRSELESAFAGPSWPLASDIIEPFRRYAITVFDVHATVYRRAASAQGRDFNEVLGAMIRNLLRDTFGIEWENSPGDKVIRIDYEYGIQGLKGNEISVIAGNDPDPSCLYHSLIGDAIKYRYRFHDVPPDPIPGEPPGINLSNVEWWKYIGLNERHNLAMAIQPYLEDRKAYWQSVFGPQMDAHSSGALTATAPVAAKVLGAPSAGSSAAPDPTATSPGNEAARKQNRQATLAADRQAVVLPILRKKGWSRGRWATTAGVSKNSVYEYLEGKRNLSDGNRLAMAEVLELKPEDLPN